jgi:chromosome segregation ATPase
LESRDSTIDGLKAAREGMETNLDNVFSDLVKLCQMYEVVEKQAEDRRVSRNEFSRQLEDERNQKRASEQRLKSQNEQLQAENDKLQQKLTRYREKLEAVKQERKGTVLDSNSHRSSARSSSNRHGVSSKGPKPSTHDARDKENYAYESKWMGSKTDVGKHAVTSRGKESQFAYESQLGPKDGNMDIHSRRKDVGLPDSQRRSRTESQYRHRPYH